MYVCMYVYVYIDFSLHTDTSGLDSPSPIQTSQAFRAPSGPGQTARRLWISRDSFGEVSGFRFLGEVHQGSVYNLI